MFRLLKEIASESGSQRRKGSDMNKKRKTVRTGIETIGSLLDLIVKKAISMGAFSTPVNVAIDEQYTCTVSIETALVHEYNGSSIKDQFYEFLNSSCFSGSLLAITGLGFLNLKRSFRNILWHCLVPRSMSYFSLR